MHVKTLQPLLMELLWFLQKTTTESEHNGIVQGLKKVQEEWQTGSFQLLRGDEDIHSANERRLKVRDSPSTSSSLQSNFPSGVHLAFIIIIIEGRRRIKTQEDIL